MPFKATFVFIRELSIHWGKIVAGFIEIVTAEVNAQCATATRAMDKVTLESFVWKNFYGVGAELIAFNSGMFFGCVFR